MKFLRFLSVLRTLRSTYNRDSGLYSEAELKRVSSTVSRLA